MHFVQLSSHPHANSHLRKHYRKQNIVLLNSYISLISFIPCQQQSKSDFEIINGFILFNLNRPGKPANPSHSNLRKLKCTDWHSINFQHFSAYYELVASPFISEICSISSLGARGRPVKGSTGRSSLRPPFRSSARIGGGGNSPALKRRR